MGTRSVFRQFFPGTFSPKRIPTIVTGILVLILLRLCAWQISRHFERNVHVDALIQNHGMDPLNKVPSSNERDQFLYRTLRVKGQFVGMAVAEAGRRLPKDSGYSIFQVFEASSGKKILVDRGELYLHELRNRIGSFQEPQDQNDQERLLGEVKEGQTVEGVIFPLQAEEPEKPIDAGEGLKVWPRRSIGKIYSWFNEAPRSMLLENQMYLRLGSERALDAQPIRDQKTQLFTGYPPPKINWDSAHYAFQWFGMAILALAFWIWSAFQLSPQALNRQELKPED